MSTQSHRADTGQLTPDPADAEANRAEERRSFEHGSSGSTADAAVETAPTEDTRSADAPHARPAREGGDHG